MFVKCKEYDKDEIMDTIRWKLEMPWTEDIEACLQARLIDRW